MSNFSEILYKKFLPTAEAYIKTVQSQHQEPMKQIAVINKEIATLTNPTNLAAASKKRSEANWTQLLTQYIKLEATAKDKRSKTEEDLNKNIKAYNDSYNEAVSSFASKESSEKIDALVGSLKNKPTLLMIQKALPGIVGEDKAGREQTKAQLFALAEIQRRLLKVKNEGETAFYPTALNHIGTMALELSGIPTVDPRFSTEAGAAFLNKLKERHESGENPINVQTHLNNSFPDIRGKKAQQALLRNPRNIPGSLSVLTEDVSLEGYSNYQDDIQWVKDKINSIDAPTKVPSTQDSYAARKSYIESLPLGLSLDEQSQRIVVDENNPPEVKSIAEKFLTDSTGKTNPKYESFVASEPMQALGAGMMSGDATQKRMLTRASELEEQKNALIQVAMMDKGLTSAEKMVLRNPLFTRTGFKRTAPYRLLKGKKARDELLAEQEIAFQQMDSGVQPDGEQVAEVRGESTGVPVVPATIKIFQDAITRYDVSGDIGPLRVVRDGFMAMPDAVRNKFPEIFAVQLAQLDADVFPVMKDGKLTGLVEKDGFNQQKRINELMVSLDQTKVTTETVSDFVALIAEDGSQANVNQTKSMVNFMAVYMTPGADAPASALGKGADKFTDPMGSLGNALANAETDEEVADVAARAARFAQGGVGYDPALYGQYPGVESVDPDEVAPEEPPVEKPEAPPVRPSRMDRRIARRAKKIDAEQREKELAATVQAKDDLELRNLDRELERDDEKDAVAEQEFLDQVDIPTLQEGDLESDPDRMATQQKRIGDISRKLEAYKRANLVSLNEEYLAQQKEKDDQAVVDAALANIQDPYTMDLPASSTRQPTAVAEAKPTSTRQPRAVAEATPTPTRQPRAVAQAKTASNDGARPATDERSNDPFDAGLPFTPPMEKSEPQPESVDDLLIAATRDGPPKRTSSPVPVDGIDSDLLIAEDPGEPVNFEATPGAVETTQNRMSLEDFDLTGRTTEKDLDSQTLALFNVIYQQVDNGSMSLVDANKTLNDYANRGPYDMKKIADFQSALNQEYEPQNRVKQKQPAVVDVDQNIDQQPETMQAGQ